MQLTVCVKVEGATPLLELSARICPPVSGIAVYQTLHIAIHPIAVALTGSLVKGLQGFFFKGLCSV